MSIQKKRRIIYNDDGGSIHWFHHIHPMTIDQHYDVVDQLLGTKVDSYALNVFCVPSSIDDKLEMGYMSLDKREIPALKFDHMRNLCGKNPFTALLDRAKEKGLEAIASIRMNDAHFAYSNVGPDKANRSEFWKSNPQLRINPDLDTSKSLRNTDEWPGALFDYSHDEVHQYILNLVSNIYAEVDADGIELDFMRHPYYFKKEDAPYKLERMTDLIRKIRLHLDKTAGKDKVLGVLVPSTLEAGKHIGLDTAAWICEGLIDYVVPKDFIRYIMDVPVKEYLEVAEGTKTQVYACLDNGPAINTSWLEKKEDNRIESFRGAAAHYWEEGIDGIYLYNYFNHTTHPHTKQDRRILKEIGDPYLITGENKRYTIYPKHGAALENERWQLPLEITGEHEINFTIGDDPVKAYDDWSLEAAELELTFKSQNFIVEEDELKIKLNNVDILWENFIPQYNDIDFHFNSIKCDLKNEILPKKGENTITINLVKRFKGKEEPLTLEKVEIYTRYK